MQRRTIVQLSERGDVLLHPTVPLPEPLRGNETGTFAEDSVVRRLPEIARRAIAQNSLGVEYVDRVEALAGEIAAGTLTLVDEPEAPDAVAWAEHTKRHVGVRWVDAPWFFVETYFYRRLLAATGYSQPGPRRGIDPFQQQKRLALDSALQLAARLGGILDDTRTLVTASLWANRVDLSLWPAEETDSDARTDAVLGPQRQTRLLVNDSDAALETLAASGASIHLVLDNAGAELIADLTLAAHVVSQGGRVTIHAKPHPTFVSDVTLPDLDATLRRLATEKTPARNIARVLTTAEAGGTLRVTTHPYWVSPDAGWHCPPDLVQDLSNSDLIIFKGDANYRRLLGDLHWDPTTAISEIVRPPRPVLALRTAKAEVVAGLTPSVIAAATQADADWMVNGEWGMIQHIPAQG